MQSLLGKMPNKPGIYFFKDKKDQVIYIGKAKSLRNRVRSYFSSINKKDTKTQILVRNIADIDYLVVRSEAEALLTEANLIKEHKPRYNVFLKDDKTFPYIRVTNDDYPKIEIIRIKNLQKDQHTYFGPYTDIKYLRKVMKCINRVFPETNETFTHLKIISTPLKEEYQEVVKKIILFLRGRSSEVRDTIKAEMNQASKDMKYEEAAKCRDQLKAIESFMLNEKKITHDFTDRDIICISSKEKLGISILIRIRNGHLIGQNRFNMSINDESDISGNTQTFIQQHYSSTMDYPKEILIDVDIKDKEKLQIWLSNLKKSSLKILKPQRGERQELVEMCRKNADLQLKDFLDKKNKRNKIISRKIKSLRKDLNLKKNPLKIEAFDVSHISGKFQVAGMVSFKNGIAYKSGYRKFKIKHDFENNDYLSISEVVFRRYSKLKKENGVLPDLILIDGGKGQLHSAKKSLDKLELGFIPVIALAKRLEEVYSVESNSPLSIKKTSPGLLLLREIRDEVHRFSINYHRFIRSKKMLKSKILEIKGMGSQRFEKLMNCYESLSQIKTKSALKIFKDTKIPISICKKIITELNS